MAKPTRLTWFAPRKTYKVKIGGKTIYLGPDQDRAAAEATALRARWSWFKSQGHQSWPQGEPNRLAVQIALGFVPQAALVGLVGNPSPLPSPLVAPQPQPSREVDALSLTLEDAGKIFMAEKEKGGAGPRQVEDIRYRLGRSLDKLGRSKPIRDIDRAALVDFVGYWRSLPKSRNQDGTEGEPISTLYARRMVQTAKAFFHWASEHEAVAWSKPIGFDSLMFIEDKASNSKEIEKLKAKVWGEEKKFFDLDNKEDVSILRKLFKAADDRMRAYMLLAFNCAYSNSELANLKVSDLKENGETWIRTIRNKTHEKMQHPLWKETVAAMKKAQAKKNKEGLYFLTVRGKPVSNHVYNSLPQLWDDLKEKAGVSKDILPFHNLRHTSANEIKKIAGPDIADIHQGHKERAAMQAIYTEKLWAEHAEAVRKLRKIFGKVID